MPAADYRRMRFALLLLLPALFAGRAATASNAVPAGPAGSGAATVSGFSVSSISYSLADDVLDGVSFTLAPAGARTVKVRVAPGEPWLSCSIVGDAVSCPLSTNVAAAAALEVVAAS